MPPRSETEYYQRKHTEPSMPSLDERLGRLERERDGQTVKRDPEPSNGPLSVSVSRENVRLRISLGLVTTIAGVLGVVATNLFSYAKGLGDERVERAADMEEVRAVREQLEVHELRVSELVSASGREAKSRDEILRQVGELQLLEWRYITQVLEAMRARKPAPAKPQDLVDAESRVQASLRDAKARDP